MQRIKFALAAYLIVGNIKTRDSPTPCNLTLACARKLRMEEICATRRHVFLQTNVRRKHDKQYLSYIVLDVPAAPNCTIELMKFSMTALNILFKPDVNRQYEHDTVRSTKQDFNSSWKLRNTFKSKRHTALMILGKCDI